MLARLAEVWRCPACAATELEPDSEAVRCLNCRASFPLAHGRPALLRPDHPLFSPTAYRDLIPAPAGAVLPRTRGVNLSRKRCLRDLARRLSGPAIVLLLGSGRQRRELREALGEQAAVIALDIDVRADVDLFADAQELPFRDQTFDAVVATAVLEHVPRPESAMAEIARTTKPGGLLYSEIPFMQQVHEGAYDFTRYTLSGHRRLASSFSEIESGVVAGPATTLVWSVEHLLLALGGWRVPRVTKAVVRGGLAWLAPVDRRIASRPAAIDGASCTFFYGSRRTAGTTPDAAIVEEYRGAQRIRHL